MTAVVASRSALNVKPLARLSASRISQEHARCWEGLLKLQGSYLGAGPSSLAPKGADHSWALPSLTAPSNFHYVSVNAR